MASQGIRFLVFRRHARMGDLQALAKKAHFSVGRLALLEWRARREGHDVMTEQWLESPCGRRLP
jgi:hypothetical protein